MTLFVLGNKMAEKDSKPTNKTEEPHNANCDDNVILHLSDLHFRIESSSTQTARRENLLNDLIDCLKNVDLPWKPTLVCITGDIAWSAKKEEYQSAQRWLNKLLSELSISPQNIVLCPGNHDVILKKAERIPRPKNTIEANKSLAIPIPPQYQDLFSTYSDFCTKLNLECAACGDYISHLFGIRQINGIYFLICNSCWFFKNIRHKKKLLFRFVRYIKNKLRILSLFINNEDNIEEKMWLGLPLFEQLDQRHGLSSLKESNRTIALLHHPERYLHEEETERFPDSTPTLEWIKERTDLILAGHSHTLPLKPRGYIICCGAGYKGRRDINVFCLIKLEAERCLCKYYTSDQSRPGNKWEQEGYIHQILFSASEKIVHTYIDRGNSLNSILVKESDVFPKQQGDTIRSPIAIADEHSGQPVNVPELDTTSIEDNLKNQIAKAQDYIGKLEFVKSFSIADNVIEKLKEKEIFLPATFLAETYSALTNIEITRVNWLNQKKGIPKDFSRAKEFYQKARDYNEKG